MKAGVDVNEVGKGCLTDAPPRHILHVGLDALTHFTKYQLPDSYIWGRYNRCGVSWHRPLALGLTTRSVTRVDQSKTVEVRIMQFSPHSTKPNLSSFCRISFIQKFQRDPPERGRQTMHWIDALQETIYFRSSNAFTRWLPMLDILSQLLQTYSPGGDTVAR